ncbi:hypothetical protein ABPG75_000496 [Micractinium tetrahymenae]
MNILAAPRRLPSATTCTRRTCSRLAGEPADCLAPSPHFWHSSGCLAWLSRPCEAARLCLATRHTKMGAGWLELGPFRTVFIPKVWFAIFNSGSVFLLPFVTILWRSLGFNEASIGIICALRPFVAAAMGSLLVSAADASQRHMAILLAVYTIAWLGRSMMAFFAGFGVQLALALITEGASAPMGALIDSAVMASQADDGGYGRIRMWASIGWGGTAPIAGAVVGAYGLKAAFLCFTALVGVMLLPTALLPMEALAKKTPPGAGQESERSGGSRSDGARGGREGGPRLSTCSDKMGGKASRDGSSAGEEAGGLLSVHVSAGSQPVLLAPPGLRAGEAGGLPSKATPPPPGPLEHTWSINTRLDNEQTTQGSSAISDLLADALDAAADSSLLPSPQRPLLSSTDKRSPSLHAAHGSSPLEIAAAVPDAGSGRSSGEAPAKGSAGEVGVWQGIKGLLADVHVLVFLMLALLMGIGNGAIGYLFLFLDELGATGTLMGLCLSANCAAEVPVFFFSGRILERIGVERALQVAMGAYVVRLSCYLALPLLPSPWFVLPVELLQGLTFALAWSAGTVHVKRIAPPHLRGTVQSIFSGLYTGVGAGLGGLGGGLLYGSFGASALFRSAALTLAAGWLAANVVLCVWGGKGTTGDTAGSGSGASGREGGARRQASTGDGEEAALLRP